MSENMLSEDEVKRFNHAASGYGAVVVGQDPQSREDVLRNHLEGPFIAIDCSKVDSEEDYIIEGLSQFDNVDVEELDKTYLSGRDLNREIRNQQYSILVLEFEELDSELQTYVARLNKGLAERMNYEKMIGYACTEEDSVVSAEFDLSMRVRSWDIS